MSFHSESLVAGERMDETGIRKWILDRTTERFFGAGFETFTMDEIAQVAGVSKKTLYRLIPSKTDLIFLVVSAQIEQVERKQAAILADRRLDFPLKLDAMVREATRVISRIRLKTVRDMMKSSPELWEMIRRRRSVLLDRVAELLEQGRREGMVRRDIPADFMARVLHQVVDSVITPQTAMEHGGELSDLLGMTLKMLYGGVLTGRGRRALKESEEESE